MEHKKFMDIQKIKEGYAENFRPEVNYKKEGAL